MGSEERTLEKREEQEINDFEKRVLGGLFFFIIQN